MRNLFSTAFRWLRRPVASRCQLTLGQALIGPYEPATVGILLDNLEQERKEHLEWADRLDRILLAVITADGVYTTILASISSTIPVVLVALVGLIVAGSFILAYLAWRPHPHDVVSVTKLVSHMDIHADDLNRVLIAMHNYINNNMKAINRWKVQMLTWAAWLFAAAALPTLLVYTLVG